MTPILQLTDTDISFSFKSSARRIMGEVRREIKAKAESAGARATFRCGPRKSC
jgi:hypothetical protein